MATTPEASSWKVPLTIAVLGGLVVVLLQLFILEPLSRSLTAPAESNSSSGGVVVDPTLPADQGSTPVDAATPIAKEPEAVEDSEVASSPAALDNRQIIEARIEFSSDTSKIAPGVWKVDGNPGYYTAVFTAAGQLDHRAGCYVHWESFNNGTLVSTGDSRCALTPGWSSSYWPRLRYELGQVKVVATITTDWGVSTTAELVYEVR